MLSEDIRHLANQLDWAVEKRVVLPIGFVAASLRAYADRAAALEAHLVPWVSRVTPDIEAETDGKVVLFCQQQPRRKR